MSTPTYQMPILASMGSASIWTVLDTVMSHGPSWHTVPPLVLAFCSLLAMVNQMLNDAARRKREASATQPTPPPPVPDTPCSRCL